MYLNYFYFLCFLFFLAQIHHVSKDFYKVVVDVDYENSLALHMDDDRQFQVFFDIVNMVFFVLFDYLFFVFVFNYQTNLFDMKDFRVYFEVIQLLQ